MLNKELIICDWDHIFCGKNVNESNESFLRVYDTLCRELIPKSPNPKRLKKKERWIKKSLNLT